ncbi:MAG: YcgN family cysteine cluster protein [Pelagimonas sp.]|jgi:uncharacterized cysteine cluster protein YcgN (CxxCxxCC family)|nr:YcgN family cysteine cluster protein [Pelagimonas sp.]
MSDVIDRKGLAPRFWERKSIDKMSQKEWEALCDGCGKCCLNKLEDEDSGVVALTRVACRLLDGSTCLCSQYDIRHQFVPECIVLRPSNIAENAYWMPDSCAYKRLYQNKPLPEWHPLITGDPNSPHQAGISLRDQTVPEHEVDDDEWEEYIIEEP